MTGKRDTDCNLVASTPRLMPCPKPFSRIFSLAYPTVLYCSQLVSCCHPADSSSLAKVKILYPEPDSIFVGGPQSPFSVGAPQAAAPLPGGVVLAASTHKVDSNGFWMIPGDGLGQFGNSGAHEQLPKWDVQLLDSLQ